MCHQQSEYRQIVRRMWSVRLDDLDGRGVEDRLAVLTHHLGCEAECLDRVLGTPRVDKMQWQPTGRCLLDGPTPTRVRSKPSRRHRRQHLSVPGWCPCQVILGHAPSSDADITSFGRAGTSRHGPLVPRPCRIPGAGP